MQALWPLNLIQCYKTIISHQHRGPSTTPGNLRGAQNGKKIPNIGEKYKKHHCCEKDRFEAVFFRLSDIFRAAEINSAGWPETLGTLGPGGIKKGQKWSKLEKLKI